MEAQKNNRNVLYDCARASRAAITVYMLRIYTTPFFAGTAQLIKAQKVLNVYRDCARARENEALGLVSLVICNRSGRKINLGRAKALVL